MTGDFRKQVADWYSTLTVVLELPGAGERVADVVELCGFDPGWEWLAVAAVKFRLRVERVDLRDTTVHVQEDDADRACWKMCAFTDLTTAVLNRCG